MGCVRRAAGTGAVEVEGGPRKSLDCTLLCGMGQLFLYMILCFIFDAQLGESLIDEYLCKSDLLGY